MDLFKKNFYNSLAIKCKIGLLGGSLIRTFVAKVHFATIPRMGLRAASRCKILALRGRKGCSLSTPSGKTELRVFRNFEIYFSSKSCSSMKRITAGCCGYFFLIRSSFDSISSTRSMWKLTQSNTLFENFWSFLKLSSMMR